MHPSINFDKLPFEVVYDPDKLGFRVGARFSTQDIIFMLQMSVFTENTIILHRLKKKLYRINQTDRLHKDTNEVYQRKTEVRDISDIFEQSEDK